MTSGRKFARNSAFNLVGLVLPLLLAVIAMPLLVRQMGVDRFGILTLAWVAVGYFGLFDLGLSRALTQAVAHRIGENRHAELPTLVWTALLLLLALGIVAMVLIAAATPLLVTRLLNVPIQLRQETLRSFYILALSLPLVVTTAGLRGLMEAHQDFGIATALKVPLLGFMLVGPLLVLPFTKNLAASVLILVLGRVVTWIAHVVVCFRRYSYLRNFTPSVHVGSALPLLRYGGWMTVSNVVSPIMVSLDRFLIGALLPIAAVAHYVTPYEVITKLSLIGVAILAAMFPSFAATFATDRESMALLYDRALRSVVVAVFPPILVAVALAHEGMLLWMGHSLPPESAVVLKWLAVGVFVNAIAQAPFAALQGAGRPDLTAKLHLIELPLYALLIWVLARSLGLAGVAIAWTLRVTLDAALLMIVTQRTLALRPVTRSRSQWAVALMLVALGAAALMPNTRARLLYVGVVAAIFVATAWRRLVTPHERHALIGWLRAPSATSQASVEPIA